MNTEPCQCGCGVVPRYPGAKFCHGHHLRLKEFQRKPLVREPLSCAFCQEKFLPKKTGAYQQARYCSRKCANDAYRAPRQVQLTCAACGEVFTIGRHRAKDRNIRCCSRACRVRYQTSLERPGSYRQNAYKSFPPVCVDCGYDTHPEILIVHHVDGIRENGALTNLAIVCPNCHVLRRMAMTGDRRVPTWRG